MSEKYRKKYIIEITGTNRTQIWYANKVGRRFEAELKSNRDSEIVVFQVNPCQFVHLTDCKIISEKTIEVY